MPGTVKPSGRALALLVGASLIWAVAGGEGQAAAARKPVARKPAAAATPKPRVPPPPMKITCGPPLPQPDAAPGKKPRKPKRGDPKLPDSCIMARFLDPAFPPADPTAAGRSAIGLFGGTGPVEAAWNISTTEIQRIADQVADAGPRPDIRATVKLSGLDLAEARAIYQNAGGRDGLIVLSTRLIQSLTKLSEHVGASSTENSDLLTQQYLRFIIAHEYAHLLLNHPQQLDKADKRYQQVGQGLQLAGMAYVVANRIKAGSDETYADKRRRARESAGILMAATFAGDIATTEGMRFLFPVFNRSVERDADMLAVDILSHSDGNPIQGVSSLQIFFDENKENVKRSGQLSDESKKTAAQAAAQIAAIAPDLLLNDDKDKTVQKLKLVALTIGANMAFRKLEEHKTMIAAHLHDSPGEREKLVNAYVDRFYGMDRFPTATVAPTAAFPTMAAAPSAPPEPRITFAKVDFKKISAEVEGYEATEATKTAMARGNLAEARKQIDIALKSPIKATVDVQLLAGGVAQAEGQHDAAIKHFRAVLGTGYNAPAVFLDIVESQRIKGDNAGALKTLAEGVAKTGQLGEFILQRIDIHRQQNDEKALAVDLTACKALNDPQLASLCEAAAAPPPPPPVQVAQEPPSTAKTLFDKVVDGAVSATGKKPN